VPVRHDDQGIVCKRAHVPHAGQLRPVRQFRHFAGTGIIGNDPAIGRWRTGGGRLPHDHRGTVGEIAVAIGVPQDQDTVAVVDGDLNRRGEFDGAGTRFRDRRLDVLELVD